MSAGDTAEVVLTGARRRALAVMAGRNPQAARISNQTSERDGTVYWQTARWLQDAGMARPARRGSEQLILTATGLRTAKRAGVFGA